ncbi:hypothetical protein I350_01138 [Cryptococcus amylolentus CBS 6273]|uniref:AB hydrolase-1 domain-containing protein n=1 Tax=Cryptococcus amylolentus CBS 6273 TaxID=1296118 RepID=A0A1E3KBU0_9TREE|nr:hypothetical protein I350_01138 [Cryptococcus amylolentus CBS 6273]
MVNYANINSAPGRLAYRLSTPRNRVATAIDPAISTVLFCHPPWLDHYFFYPQLDDPTFYNEYNLVAIDMPGHGMSLLEEPMEGEMTWERIAGLYYEVLQALKVEKVHLVGGDMGSLAPMRLALAHPEIVESLTMMQMDAVRTQDLDLIDTLNVILFEFATGQWTNQILRDVRDEWTDMAKARMLRAEYLAHLQVFLPLLTTRMELPTKDEMGTVNYPILIIENVMSQGDGNERNPTNNIWLDFTRELNSNRAKQGESRLATRHALVGEVMTKWASTARWTSITNPCLINPLITEIIKNKSSSSAFDKNETPMGRCLPREPDLPRDTGDLLEVLHETSTTTSQAKPKSWADFVNSVQGGGCEVQTEITVEVEE